MNKTEKQARKLYEHNKKYVEANEGKINALELCKIARKQDQLYLIFNR